MVNFEKIMNLTPDDVIILSDLRVIAQEAKAHAELIHKAYRCFGIGEERIEVWHDSYANNFEYLTYSGFWQARYLHQTYDIECTADSIFDYYRAEYLVKKGFLPESNSIEKTKEEACRYFRCFVRRIKISE